MKSLGQSIREGIGNYVTLKSAGEQSNLRKLQAMLALAKIGQMGQPIPQGYSQYGGKLYPNIGEQLKMLGNFNMTPNQDQTNLGLGTGQGTLSRLSGGLKTLTLPTLSRSGLGFKQVFDPRSLMEMKSEQKQQEQINKMQTESTQASGEIEGMISNLVSNLKAANIEQGGGGPFKGIAGNVLARFGAPHTGNIVGLKNTVRDTAIKMAQRLSGGNRGAQILFQRLLESIPTNLNTEEQQATALHDMYLTAHSIKKATAILGIDKISRMVPDEFSQYISSVLSPEETNQATQSFSKLLQKAGPRPEFNLTGEFRQPQATPFLRKFQPSNPPSNQTNQIKTTQSKDDPLGIL